MLVSSISLLFTYPTVQTPFHSLAEQSIEKQIDNNGMVQMQDIRLKTFLEQYEKTKEENIIKKVKEIKKQKELEKQKNNESEWQTFIVSFYTGLDEENFEGCGGRNCLNQPLEKGMIANNSLPMGTKIFLDNDYGIRTVADKGSSRFNSENRIDLYVTRWDGETREQWKHRAESYGIKTIRGYIVK
jgi:hypothetical protein